MDGTGGHWLLVVLRSTPIQNETCEGKEGMV